MVLMLAEELGSVPSGGGRLQLGAQVVLGAEPLNVITTRRRRLHGYRQPVFMSSDTDGGDVW